MTWKNKKCRQKQRKLYFYVRSKEVGEACLDNDIQSNGNELAGRESTSGMKVLWAVSGKKGEGKLRVIQLVQKQVSTPWIPSPDFFFPPRLPPLHWAIPSSTQQTKQPPGCHNSPLLAHSPNTLPVLTCSSLSSLSCFSTPPYHSSQNLQMQKKKKR